MESTWKEVSEYLGLVSGGDVTVRPWGRGNRLPLHMAQMGEFSVADLGGAQVLLVRTAEVGAKRLATVGRLLGDSWQGPIAFVLPPVHRQTRYRLKSARVPFVVPGSQAFIPGISLIEQSRSVRRSDSVAPAKMSPSSQVALFILLLDEIGSDSRVTDLAVRSGYTKMSAGRAVSELEALRLLTVETAGRERRFALAGTKRQVWDRALPYLLNPVRFTVWADRDIEGLTIAGDSALGEFSRLAPPRVSVRAVTSAQYRALKREMVLAEAAVDSAMDLQVWRYDPSAVSARPVVDPLSLYTSYNQEALRDPRLGQALEEMMEGLDWYRD